MNRFLNLHVDPETGDSILDLPIDFCEELGWEVGDTIKFTQQDDGSIVMTKEEQRKLFAVEELVTFRNVYFVMAKNKVDAADSVVMGEPERYFQQHVDSAVMSSRQIDRKGMAELIQETEQPNVPLQDLMSEQKN